MPSKIRQASTPESREAYNQYKRELYAFRKSLGLCGLCNRIPEDGKALCEFHLAQAHKYDDRDRQKPQYLEYQRAYREANKAKAKEYRDARRAQLVAEGKCTRCKEPASEHATLCESCLKLKREYNQKNKKKRLRKPKQSV